MKQLILILLSTVCILWIDPNNTWTLIEILKKLFIKLGIEGKLGKGGRVGMVGSGGRATGLGRDG